MALRSKSRDDKKAETPDAPAHTGTGAPPLPDGPSVEECVAAGQALVEAGMLAGERLTEALADGEGDLFKFGNVILTKYGIGRAEYAKALGSAFGLPVADTRADPDKELAERVDEKIARKFSFIPFAD